VAPLWWDQHEVAAAVAANIPTLGCALGSHKLTLCAILGRALPAEQLLCRRYCATVVSHCFRLASCPGLGSWTWFLGLVSDLE